MLTKLTIKNVALIENAEIEFTEGLNVLSGETGAGKSVILDSVNFVLGAKADRTMIRYGENECMVKAEFLLSEKSKAVQELRDLDIESEGEIIISRKFSEVGKNSIKINGNTVTSTMLRKVTDCLVDVHGQSEHFFLLKENNQLKTLDEVVGEPLFEKKEVLAILLKEKRFIEEQIAKLGGNEQERGRRLDVLKFQIDEIESVALQEGEEELLIAKRNKINNLEKIIDSIRESLEVLSGEMGVADGLRKAKRAISSVSKLGEEYQNVEDRIEGVVADLEDVVELLSDIADGLNFDENEAEETEARLDAIRALKRKYGANKAEIDCYYQNIVEEYDLLSDCEGKYEELSKALSDLQKRIYRICCEMTDLRKNCGAVFCENVVKELATLNIPSAQFSIDFNEYTEADVIKANHNGLDQICFLFSANAGEPLKPLGKIISGGEMSRFMLAIKTRLSGVNETCT